MLTSGCLTPVCSRRRPRVRSVGAAETWYVSRTTSMAKYAGRRLLPRWSGRRLLLGSVSTGAALTLSCLAPTPTEAPSNPAPPRATRTTVAPCAPTPTGEPRVIIRRGYLEDPVFRLVESRIELDGKPVFRSTDEARLRTEVDVVVDAPVPAGRHELTSLHRLTGRGSGAHSYLNSYRFEIPSKHLFDVRSVGATCVTVTLWFREGDTIPLEERPALTNQHVWGDPGDAGGAEVEKDAG